MSLCRTWLISNLLPTECLYFVIKFVVQVINYMPFVKDNTWAASSQCIYNMKLYYRNLISIFSIVYVKIFRDCVKH